MTGGPIRGHEICCNQSECVQVQMRCDWRTSPVRTGDVAPIPTFHGLYYIIVLFLTAFEFYCPNPEPLGQRDQNDLPLCQIFPYSSFVHFPLLPSIQSTPFLPSCDLSIITPWVRSVERWRKHRLVCNSCGGGVSDFLLSVLCGCIGGVCQYYVGVSVVSVVSTKSNGYIHLI